MTVLVLRLAAPLQSWGEASRFTERRTRSEPTKSGVLGLLAAAQGRRRTDPIEDLVRLRFGVRVDQPGRIVRDFHTAIRWSDPKHPSMPLSYRYYLEDAVFVAGVEGDRSMLEGLDAALADPVFPLYLGRRSCPTSGRLSLGVSDGDLENVLRGVDWQAARWHRRRQGATVDLPLYLDAAPGGCAEGEASEVVRDVPLSFSPERREYGWRDVVHARPEPKANADSRRTGLDFMAALGGA